MNYNDTLKSVELVLSTKEVPLIIGESGIGKTALAKQLARTNDWRLIVIDGNLLKEGEIGGLPAIESYRKVNEHGEVTELKTTVYAIHNKLREIDEALAEKRTVLLFVDEINRCEHTVQQELMNLILNREINGYQLQEDVRILAAMNPSGKYGAAFDYQVVDMDAAQENRFVWLYMESDSLQWLEWAMDAGIDQKVLDFISTFPEYLHRVNEDDIRATPRSYERISKVYKVWQEQKDTIPRSVFFNVLQGNVGKFIAQEFLTFMESNHSALISFEDIFTGNILSETIVQSIRSESHTRLFLATRNILKRLTQVIRHDIETDYYIDRVIVFLENFPVDLRVGIMKEIKISYPQLYHLAIEKESFVDLYFNAIASVRER